MPGDDPHEFPFPLRELQDRLAVHTSSSANILRVTVGTNCPRGGDSGHGGYTFIEFDDLASTAMSIEFQEPHSPAESHDLLSGKFRLVFRGDTECDTLIDCLDFAAKTLRAQRAFNIGATGNRSPLGLMVTSQDND